MWFLPFADASQGGTLVKFLLGEAMEVETLVNVQSVAATTDSFVNHSHNFAHSAGPATAVAVAPAPVDIVESLDGFLLNKHATENCYKIKAEVRAELQPYALAYRNYLRQGALMRDQLLEAFWNTPHCNQRLSASLMRCITRSPIQMDSDLAEFLQANPQLQSLLDACTEHDQSHIALLSCVEPSLAKMRGTLWQLFQIKGLQCELWQYALKDPQRAQEFAEQEEELAIAMSTAERMLDYVFSGVFSG